MSTYTPSTSATHPTDRRWLRALIWHDHPDRAQRLDLAARAAARGPVPHIHPGDATECLPELLTQAPADTTVVVFHTAVLTPFTQHVRAAFEQQLHQLCTLRPITWIQGEPQPDQQPRLRLAQLANARIQTELPLGRYHPHGAWLEWVNTEIPPSRPHADHKMVDTWL